MIVEKNPIILTEEETDSVVSSVQLSGVVTEQEAVTVNALCEVFKAVKDILSKMHTIENDPSSPLLWKTIKLNNGQLNRIKNNKWNKEYALAMRLLFGYTMLGSAKHRKDDVPDALSMMIDFLQGLGMQKVRIGRRFF